MLSSETKVVTYVNKKGERSTYPLNSAMESANLEMVKRLKYTKDILTHMLNANAANLNSKPGDGPDPTAPSGTQSAQTGRPQTSGSNNLAGGAAAQRNQATERVQPRPNSGQFN